MARVQLDTSHVSKSVTARREKVTRYIRVFNELSKVRTFRIHSLRLRVLKLTVRENLHGSCSLSIWWFGHWLGRWNAIGRSGAALFLCRFLRWISKRNGGLKRCARRSFDEAVSSVPVNRQDQGVRCSCAVEIVCKLGNDWELVSITLKCLLWVTNLHIQSFSLTKLDISLK